MSIRSLCSKDRVTYQPRASAVGTAGSQSFSHSGTAGKRCMVQPMSSASVVVAHEREYLVTHTLYFVDNPSSGHGDRFVIESPASLAGKVLEQVGEPVDQTGRGRLWAVLCEERQRSQ